MGGAEVASTLILGIRSTPLLEDDAGAHTALRIKSHSADLPDVRVLDAGTLGVGLLPELHYCSALLILDAARDDRQAGTVMMREGAAMDAVVRRRGRRVHEVGLGDLDDTARLSLAAYQDSLRVRRIHCVSIRMRTWLDRTPARRRVRLCRHYPGRSRQPHRGGG